MEFDGNTWTFNGGTIDGTNLAAQLNSMMGQYDRALNCLWLMVAAALVFWMQGGFAMLEVGSVRAKNAQNILLKNLLDITVGAAFWFGCGAALSGGETVGLLFGSTGFFGSGYATAESEDYINWFFGWTFAATAATIVSGALAERTKFEGYAFFSMAMTGFIYPVATHWVWAGGLLASWGFSDFAGSGVVHALAGVSALTGAIMVGPRTNRFAPGFEGKFAPHNIPLVMLGTVILWMGWYGFNCGSTFALARTADAVLVSRIAMVTTLAAAFGGITAFLVRATIGGVYDVSAMCNGVLAGLVGITAVCDSCGPWSAVFCGAGGGLVLVLASSLVQRFEIDDPLDAFAVHGAAGVWGTLCVGLVHMDNGLMFGGGLTQLGAQTIGIIVLILWSSILSALVFGGLKALGQLRVSQDVEDAGLDIREHGAAAYQFTTNWRGSVIGLGGNVDLDGAPAKATELTAQS